MNTSRLPKIGFFLFFLLFIYFFVDITTADAWLDGYSNRKIITIDAANIDEALTDFPVYVDISNDTDIGVKMQDTSNYYDIRFTDTDDNILPYEEENMSISSGSATGSYWVQSDLSSTTGGTLYVYYGKTGDTDGSSATSVWNSGFKAVWHLGEGDSTDADFYKDSTSNNNDGTLSDSNGDVTATSTQTGTGLNFVGTTNDRVNVGNNSSLNVTSTYSLSGWVNLDSYDSSGYAFLIAKDDYPDGGSYDLGLKSDKPYTAINTNPTGTSWSTHTVGDVLPLNSWHYLTAVRNSDNTLDYYVDGALDETFTGVTTPAVSTVDVTLGLRSADGLQLHGTLDELRIESVSREAEWIKFTYNNINESDNELSFGSEQENVTPTVSTLSPVDSATGVAVNTSLVITFDEIVDAESGNITLMKSSDDSTIETFDVTTDISGSGSTEITINPASNLANGIEYYIQIDATAFDDLSGNSYAGITNTTTWNFTTVASPASSSSTGVHYGCKDKNAINYEYFSAHKKELCEYDTEEELVIIGFEKKGSIEKSVDSVPIRSTDNVVESDFNLSILNGHWLMRGDKNELVSLLQKQLNFYGAQIAVDGYFWTETETAVHKFQEQNNLQADGIVGPQTFSALR